MKIVDRKTFISMPAGTLFSKYTPHIFSDLCIKGKSVKDIDFNFQPIVDSIDYNDSGEFSEKLFQSAKEGSEVNFDFHCESRDGLFEADQLFAVWSHQDVEQLIARLQECLKR